MLKILSIGNSFSQDAQKYLHGIAESLGKEIHNVNLYIGGCSLERHHTCMTEDLADYTLEIHGTSTGKPITLKEGLLLEEWDCVTLQQVSTRSADFESYIPFIKELADYVRQLAPKAKILLHETWSYDKAHLGKKYGRTVDMFSRIERAYRRAAELIGADGIIPAGEAMERMKALGIPVHSDGKHASRSAGRYVTALTWYNYLFGEDGRDNSFTDIEGGLPRTYRKAAGECAAEAIANMGNYLCDTITTHDVYYAEDKSGYAVCDAARSLDLYLPDNGVDFPVFVYFHGGGIVAGDKERETLPLAKFLAKHGVAFISANYRMYPYARYPDFIQDAAAAVAWAKKHITEYGGSGKVFVGGSSAGGYLSLMLCFDRKYLNFSRAFGIDCDIAGYVHDAGQPTTHFNVLTERGFDRKRLVVDEAAPLYYVGAEKEYPPMLFTLAETDLKQRREQTELLLSTMRMFEYDMSKVELKIFDGETHTSYVPKLDEDGESVYGKTVLEFISKY